MNNFLSVLFRLSCACPHTESYSMIAMPNADSHTARTMQEDNTELAYEAL